MSEPQIMQDFEKAFQEEQKKMKWSPEATEHEKTLVHGNCHRVALWAFKWTIERAHKEKNLNSLIRLIKNNL